ncbi:MAG: hypothetical protein FJZ01_10315 [Candidatus Sericytochromatia bacterium]|nr:hypothetical protein [Candidatus Tanganyikabacteria bacterium]
MAAMMIGGEIHIDPAYAPPAGGADIAGLLDLPADRTALFGAARQAVRFWIDRFKPPGAVLLPAYCCRSVVQPYADAGVPYSYYPVDRSLRPDLGALRDMIREAGAIQAIHYFGFPAPPDLFGLGTPVLEDAVQAVLSPDLRRSGAWAIGSLRKFFPVPDGAFLIAREPFAAPPLPPAIGGLYGRKLYGRMRLHEAVRRGDAAAWAEALDLLAGTEDELETAPVRPHAMSPGSQAALRGCAVEDMAAARRRNYTTLFDALRPVFADPARGLRPLTPELSPGVVPYGLAVLSERRDALRAHLRSRGIYAVVHWELPDDVSREAFPDSWWVYARTLTLPVDHRYGAADMAEVAAAVAAFR